MVAALAAGGLVESARLVDVFPWLAVRVPPPAPALIVAYYAALACSLWLHRGRIAARLGLLACIGAILTGVGSPVGPGMAPSGVRLTMFDVGQGDALLLQSRGGRTLMIDSGGVGFDGAAFDIGGRVLAPALWARGVRRLESLAITHGDPDHVGGAPSLIRDFTPAQVWQGIPVPGHPASAALAAAAADTGAAAEVRLAGWAQRLDGARLRVLHPPPADWERVRVRNDDSIVIEIVYGDVAMLLTGDISAAVEETLISMLTPARIRILKVAHHGSRTSTGQALVDVWRPTIALISCGRGNRFGHPVPEVLQRLESAGARIYRTDRDGQITVDTDGKSVAVRRFRSHEGTKNTKVGGE
jgi:competence protein ComEC